MRVEWLMREAGNRVLARRCFVRTMDSDHHPIASNLLEQDFRASGPNQRWVMDFTYIPMRGLATWLGKILMAVVVDSEGGGE